MQDFEIKISVADGQISWVCDVPTGNTVDARDAADVCTLALGFFHQRVGQRILSRAEAEALEAEHALPEGWEATADGVNVQIVDGVVSHSRTYSYANPNGTEAYVTQVAPCAPDGSPIPATITALLAA